MLFHKSPWDLNISEGLQAPQGMFQAWYFHIAGEQISRNFVAPWTNGIRATSTNPENFKCWSSSAQMETRIDSKASTWIIWGF